MTGQLEEDKAPFHRDNHEEIQKTNGLEVKQGEGSVFKGIFPI
jgi:hypothetical protein